MSSPARRASWALVSALLLLGACAARGPVQLPADGTAAPARTAAADDGPVDTALHAFARAQAEQAARAEASGQWAAAALSWEVLSLVSPDDKRAHTRLAEARRQANAVAVERLAVAEAAQRRGDLDAASQAYLEVLALDPMRRSAAEALRQIERERNRRSLVGRMSRLPIARRSGADIEITPAANGDPTRSANSVREHATLLARQGDLDAAIQMLRDSPLRNEAVTRAMLADLYVQKAESIKHSQPEAARAAVNAALVFDRRHPAALTLQQHLAKPKALATPGTAAAPAPRR